MSVLHRLAAPVAVAGACAGACAAVFWADPTTPGGPIPVCPTRGLFGVWCPGCGSSRMVYALLHGDLPAALRFNAVGVVALAVLAYTLAVWVSRRARNITGRWWYEARWAPQLVLAVVVAWFVIRNIPAEPFTSLRV